MGVNVFVLIFLHICILPVFTQRWQRQVQRCYTPDNYIGICLPLPNCPSVAALYGSNRNSPDIVPYFMGLRRNCGNRKIGYDPVICCSDAYRSPPLITTQPPITRPTPTPIRISTPPPITTSPLPNPGPISSSTPQTRLDRNCYGPDLLIGVCKDIKQCPLLLNRLSANPKDSDFVQFLRESNEICGGIYSHVCCPNEDRVTKEEIIVISTVSPPKVELSGKSFINSLPTVADGCGISPNEFNKVVGGEDAKIGSWPWIALLGYQTASGIDFKCGGTLITQRHILTAAHCIINDLTIVRLGEHDLRIDTETQHIDVPVAKTEIPQTYTLRDKYADIALVYLNTTVQFTDRIKPICLPTTPELRSKSIVDYTPFVIGWGKTEEGGKASPVLQELQIPIYNNSVCISSYFDHGRYVSKRQFDESIVCAGFLEGGKDTCQGDSGGPLMLAERFNKTFFFFEFGVVSYGIGCARPKIPGIYTSVRYYIDWIQQKVAETN